MFTIISIGDHATVRLAAQELRTYLERATGQTGNLESRQAYQADLPALWVGLSEHFISVPLHAVALHAVRDVHLDDAIAIDTHGDTGIITGNNPRSVLIAAYRYLHELGCRWVRPAPDGDYIPHVDLAKTIITVNETPSYRHRGICIEGSVSREHVLEIIRWLPKVGMNSYFVQFREAFTFFERYASSQGQVITIEDTRQIVDDIVAEAKARDLLYHAVGHGWTCEPFGMRGLGWDYPPEPVPPESVQFLAQVNGARELWGGVPLNTNLCYSNPEVRRRITEAIAEYAQTHPSTDIIHFWLADGWNNHCECELCCGTSHGTSPSDFYVKMLNEVDVLLTQRELNTRIVFLIYFDLLWPPVREKIAHPERFILMFAPITRTYSRAFAVDQALPELPPFVLNKLSFPRSVEENVSFLRAWQGEFEQPIDSFDFDYHLMWDHANDPGQMQTARVLHRDLQLLRDLDLDGFNSCQVQRASFPTGLSMTIMGWTLWNRERAFEPMVEDYFAAAYGPDGAQVRAYLERLSELFDPVYLRGEKADQGAQAAAKLHLVPDAIAAFEPVVEQHIDGVSDDCWRQSWQLLRVHGMLATLLAQALESRALGKTDESLQRWETLKAFMTTHQADLDSTFDDWLFKLVYGRKFANTPAMVG